MFRARWTATLTLTAVALAGCQTTGSGVLGGSQQQWGSVLGAVGGALVGSQIGGGSGRTIAVILGALAGGVLGNQIGAHLDERDREALAIRSQDALASGEAVQWASAHSGATGTIRPVASRVVEQDAQVRRSPRIARVDNLSVINQPYTAVKSANLRAAPSTGAEKVGGFRVGQSFTALGRTGNDWIAVGRHGTTVGYVHAPLVAPVAQAKAGQATDLDSLTVGAATQQGFDLDAIQPATPVTEKVLVQTTCRTLEYEVNTKDGQQRQSVDACQGADGAWQLG